MAEIGKLWKFRHWNFILFIEQNKTFSALRRIKPLLLTSKGFVRKFQPEVRILVRFLSPGFRQFAICLLPRYYLPIISVATEFNFDSNLDFSISERSSFSGRVLQHYWGSFPFTSNMGDEVA